MPKYLDMHGLETLTGEIENTYLKKSQRGAAGGVASLNSSGKVPSSQLPDTGTSDYTDLTNKPQINGTTLSGNKTSANLGIHDIPSGGTTGQVLAKSSDSNYAVQWVNQQGGGGHDIPTGGTQGQILAKHSATDYDVEWATPADPTSVIDDNAGPFTTDKTFSSSKLWSELGGKVDKTGAQFNDISMGRVPNSTVGTKSIAIGTSSDSSQGAIASGDNSVAVGTYVQATGSKAIAIGSTTQATGINATAIGGSATASGDFSFSHGSSTTAQGINSTAEGYGTTASGIGTHAEGNQTFAVGDYSHSQGYGTRANGYASSVEGNGTVANGANSSVSGMYNVPDSYANWPDWAPNTDYAAGDKVHFQDEESGDPRGEYFVCNTSHTSGTAWITYSFYWDSDNGKMNYAQIVGNGSNYLQQSNAYTLDWNGNGSYAGDVTINKGTVDEVSVSELKTEITNKQDAPSTAGTAGQVLGLNNSLEPEWVDQTGGGVDPQDIEDAVDAWLTTNITNPDSPPLDRSLSSGSSAAPADMVGSIANLEPIQKTAAVTTFVQGSINLNNGTVDSTSTTCAVTPKTAMKSGDSFSFTRANSNIAATAYYVLFDANDNYVSYGSVNSGSSVTFSSDGKFIIEIVKNSSRTPTIEEIISYANASCTATLSENLEIIETIAEHETRIDDVEDAVKESIGSTKVIKNIVPTFDWVTGKYVKAADGSIQTIADTDYKISGFLQIPDGAYCVVCDATNIKNSALCNIVSFYRSDSDSSYISGIALKGQSSFYSLVPDDAKYYIIGSNTDSSGVFHELNDDIMFLYGELFRELKFKLRCAAKYDVIKGEPFEFFYKGIVNGPSENYSIFTRGSTTGYNLTRKFEITPTGNVDLFFDLYDEKKTLNATIKTTLVAHNTPSNPSSMKTILCVGDSLTSPGVWPEEFYRRLTASDGSPTGFGLTNVQFIGTVTHNGVKHEGHGGWGYNHFNTNQSSEAGEKVITCTHDKTEAEDQHSIYKDSNNATWKLETIESGKIKIILQTGSASSFPTSGTLTWVSGGSHHTDITYTNATAGSSNPFWNDITGEVDFENYATEQGVSAIDYVYVLLGWNETTTYMSDLKTKAQTFITNVHDSFPDAKVVLMGVQIPSRDGLGYNYAPNTKLSNYQKILDFVFDLDDMYAELASENSNVYSLSIAAQFDTDHNMQTSAMPYNLRNATTEQVQTNGVHPADSGYLQIADAVTRHFVGLLEEE